jgi:hypothetical protein
MAVPDTSTFDLQTVVNVVNPTTDDLVDSFADAVASKFDSTYSGSKNQLLNFRNYDSTVVNTLTVTTTSTGAIGALSFAYVENQSTSTQNLTFTWQYVSQSGDLPATVSYGGTARSAGYTTPAITEIFDYGAKYPSGTFSISGGNATTIVFKFTLTNASVDNVPSAPDNATQMNYRQNY